MTRPCQRYREVRSGGRGTGNQNGPARRRVKGDEQDPQEDARAKWRRRGILGAAIFAAGPVRSSDGSECHAAASRQKFIKTCKPAGRHRSHISGFNAILAPHTAWRPPHVPAPFPMSCGISHTFSRLPMRFCGLPHRPFPHTVSRFSHTATRLTHLPIHRGRSP